MPKPVLLPAGKRLPLIQGVIFYLVTLIGGLWAVDWSVARLPAWLYLYALLPGALSVLSDGMLERYTHGWRRTVARGMAWALPVAAMVASQEFLRGGLHTLSAWIIFLAVWLGFSVVYGFVLEWSVKRFVARSG